MIMSKIYFTNKQEFINNITSGNNVDFEITFIKKYHKYKPFLNFFPPVLTNIIFEYINDIIVLKYKFSSIYLYVHMYVNVHTYINYKRMIFDINIYFSTLSTYFESLNAGNTKNIPFYNEFMKRHYKKESYFSDIPYSPIPNHEYFSELKEHNIIRLKHEIILTKIILDCVTKTIIF